MTSLAAVLLSVLAPSCVTDVRPMYSVAPDYVSSVQLVDVQASGVVTVRATVSPHGTVVGATAKGSLFLREASLAAARQWTFAAAPTATGPCVVELVFRYELLPPDAPSADLGTRYTYPWAMAVRARRPHGPGGSGPVE